jgi:hypothetical protein
LTLGEQPVVGGASHRCQKNANQTYNHLMFSFSVDKFPQVDSKGMRLMTLILIFLSSARAGRDIVTCNGGEQKRRDVRELLHSDADQCIFSGKEDVRGIKDTYPDISSEYFWRGNVAVNVLLHIEKMPKPLPREARTFPHHKKQ